MKISVHVDSTIQEWFDEIQRLNPLLLNPSSIITEAIKTAHTALSLAPQERFVFRNEELHTQGDIYVGPEVWMRKAPRQYPAVEVELDSIVSLQMEELIQKRFAEDEESAALRAVQLYHVVLAERNRGYTFGYLDDEQDFIPVEL